MSDLWWDIPAGILLVSGAFLSFAAGVGITRFPDLLARMHAATKPQALGVMLMCGGLALRLHEPAVLWMLILVVGFQFLTNPVAAHMVGRAGYRTGQIPPEDLTKDELSDDQRAATMEFDTRLNAAATRVREQRAAEAATDSFASQSETVAERSVDPRADGSTEDSDPIPENRQDRD